MLDTLRAIPTPEGIELTLKVAGPVSRARAWLVDGVIRLLMLIAFSFGLASMGKVGTGILLLLWFSLEWLYPVLFEVLWQGATPGKRLCHLRVLHEDGTPIGWRASVARNLLRAVDFLPFFYGFGVITMLLNRDFKRLGDLAAGTIVVYTEQRGRPKSMLKAEPLPTALQLNLREQRAIVDFAERRAGWSDQRAEELAMHAGPLVGGAAEGMAAIRLVRIANFLVGRR
jgi:uncharacterized RDD family membrane protein YckC